MPFIIGIAITKVNIARTTVNQKSLLLNSDVSSALLNNANIIGYISIFFGAP